MLTRPRRRTKAAYVLAAVSVLLPGPSESARGEEGPVPDSCTPHGVHVVTPGCVPAAAGAARDAVAGTTGPLLEPGTTHPNLRPNVATVYVQRPFVSFDPATGQFVFGPPTLFFDTHAENHGTVPLDLLNDEPDNVANPAVSQCVSWTTDFVCRRRQRVGGFELHPTHGHFHFENFARYELRALLPDGTADWSGSGLLGSSDKVSFCLVDSRPHGSDARPAPVYVLCSSVREGISPGWSDVYTADLPGQRISLGGLPDGQYALVVEMNYGGDLFESTYADNRVVVTVEVSGDRQQAVIVHRAWM